MALPADELVETVKRHAEQAKPRIQLALQQARAELVKVRDTLRTSIPNANALIVMKDIEKAQRQIDKIAAEIGSLIL